MGRRTHSRWGRRRFAPRKNIGFNGSRRSGRMPTIHQLVRKGRERIETKTKSPALQASPQKRGVSVRVYTQTTKTPNPAPRKAARVRLTNRIEVTPYIPRVRHS